MHVRPDAARRSQAVAALCAAAVVTVFTIPQGWPARLRLLLNMMPRQQSVLSIPPPFRGPSSVLTRLAGHGDRSLPALNNSKIQQLAHKMCRETHKTFHQFDTKGMHTQQCLLHDCNSSSLQQHLSASISDLSLNRSLDLSEQTPQG